MGQFDLLGYLFFAFVTSITPGPNNYLLLANGRAFGLFLSIRLMLGIFLGFTVMLLLTGYGIGQLLLVNRVVELFFKIISSLWLLYLAYLMSVSNTNDSITTPLNIGFTKGFFMQFVNPKAWVMALSGASAFMPTIGNLHVNVIVFSFFFGVVGIPCMVLWVLFGDLQTRLFQSPKSHSLISWILAALMVSGVLLIWV